MKYLTITIACFVQMYAQSQINLVKSDFATSNDTVRVSVVNPTTVDFSTTGSNQTWDFSTLVANTQNLVDFQDLSNVDLLTNAQFGAFAPANHKASYFLPATDVPISQIGSLLPTIQIEDVYRYYKVSDTAITAVGISILTSLSNLPKASDIQEEFYELPLDFGNQYTSLGYTNMDFNPIFDAKFIQHRQRDAQVDGYGTITTPYNTFQVLRIHHTIQENDSLYINYSGFTQWIPINVPISHEYEWWAKDEKLPVLKIVTSEVAGTETVTSIKYRDEFRYDLVAGITTNSIELGVFPNPTSDELTIKSAEPIKSIFVYDMKGAMVYTSTIEAQKEAKISVATLKKGQYSFVVNFTNGGSSKSSFIVE